MALTRITKGVIKPNENYDTHDIVSTGIVTAVGLDINGNADISGNFSVGGVLTYEDVTSIDSVGVITARQGIKVGTGITIGPAGVGTFTSVHAIDSFACQKYPTTKISFPTNSNHLQIFTNNTQRMRFYAGGTIFIGEEDQSPSGNAALYLNRSSTSVFSDSSRLYDQPNHAMVHIKNYNATGGGEAGIVLHNDNGAAGVVAIYGKKTSSYTSDCIFRFRDGGSTSVESFRVRTTDIKVGTGVTIETNGQATFSGIVTATSFVGSGANLTGIDATAIKDSGGNVKVQAQASGAVYTGIHTFNSGAEVGSNIKLGNAGVITATSFVGDGSDLTNLPAGLGTALSATATSPLNKMYYTNAVLGIAATTTVDVPASASAAYTQYADINIATDADLIIADGDDLIPDVLGLADFGTFGGGTAGRLRVSSISNHTANGAPTVQHGLVVTGVTTSTTFSGSGASLTNLPSAQLTGALPAIDGSNLTGLSGVSVANQLNNRLITATGTTDALNGEVDLVWDGSRMGVLNQAPQNQYFNTLVVGNNSGGDKGITIRTNNTSKGVLAFSDTDSADANRYDGYISYQHSDQSMRFYTGGANERLQIDSAGRFLKGLTGSGASRSSTSVRYPHFQLSSPWSSGLGSIKFECTDDYPIIFIDSNASYANGSGAGVITWSVKDSSGDYCNTASIRSHIDGTPSNDSAPGRLEFHTTTSGTSPSVKMTIDSAGRVTKPNTPFVMVHIQTTSNRQTTGSYLVVPWDIIHVRGTSSNMGSHFNTSNHRFTAPVAGRYLFAMSLNIVGDNIVKHRINGSDVSKAEYRITDNVWDHADASFIYDMNANDYYDVVSSLTGTGFRFNGGSNGFEGWDTLSIYLLG